MSQMQPNTPDYDPMLGEDDLFAPRLLRFPWKILAIPLLLGTVAVIGGCALMGVWLLGQISTDGEPVEPFIIQSSPTLAALSGQPGQVLSTPTSNAGPTATPPPTAFFPTLTPQPPTITPTPTVTPCIQVVAAGDSLTSLSVACGHRHRDVIDLIVEINNLRSPDNIQVGQVIEIPWPTPTLNPDAETFEQGAGPESAVSTAPPVASGAGGGDELAAVLGEFVPDAVEAEPTLQPGVMWYTVQSGDNILSIALQFNANIRILSELNPEVTFSQCDFGMDSGGGSCIVLLFEGQRIRVPAPTPTPTLSPTPSGSETPTPTPTATFNAPSLFSPGDRAQFGPDDIITLRWVTTGTLAPGEIYLLTVTDETANVTYTLTTSDTLYIVPDEWQLDDGQRHTFTWNIAIGPADGANRLASVTFASESRTFTWDSH